MIHDNTEGAEKIKNKILKEANNEADKIIKQAEEEAKKINDKNKAQLSDFKKNRGSEISASIKLFKDKTLAIARLKSKREFLSMREQIINRFIQDFLAKINRKSANYKDYLKKILEESLGSISGETTVYCNKEDMNTVNELCNSFGKDKVYIKPKDIDGGLMFENKSGERINESLSSRLERIKGELRQNIAKHL
jgi:vacuolar-type H+-ATPase subunit E/Vma4|tara:strand:+ start:110 stop:691 length:582 start_codon:yes stop_codon:yes gene_type:complete